MIPLLEAEFLKWIWKPTLFGVCLLLCHKNLIGEQNERLVRMSRAHVEVEKSLNGVAGETVNMISFSRRQ